jgi:hypothetical protein
MSGERVLAQRAKLRRMEGSCADQALGELDERPIQLDA